MDASSQVLLFAPVCSQVVLLDECNIALFAFGFSFGPIGGDTFKQSWTWRNNMLTTLLWRFCCFYMRVLRLCFWMNLTLPFEAV